MWTVTRKHDVSVCVDNAAQRCSRAMDAIEAEDDPERILAHIRLATQHLVLARQRVEAMAKHDPT